MPTVSMTTERFCATYVPPIAPRITLNVTIQPYTGQNGRRQAKMPVKMRHDPDITLYGMNFISPNHPPVMRPIRSDPPAIERRRDTQYTGIPFTVANDGRNTHEQM